MSIIRGRQEPAETERADGADGGAPARRSILGGLAALPVLYTVASATPALASTGLASSAARPGSVTTAAGDDLAQGRERRYNAPLRSTTIL